MNYDKGFFDSPEFRELLKKYTHARAMGIQQYFGIEEFVDLVSYFLFMEKYNEAAATLAEAKHLHPTAPECTKMEIKLLLCKGETHKALEKFRSIGYIEDNEGLILKAEVLLALKDFKSAHDIALKLLQNARPDDDVVYDAMELLLDCGLAQEALPICEDMLKKAPGRKVLLEIKAECLIEMQRTDSAIEIYNSLLDEDPYSTFYWEQLGHIYYMIKKYGKALECFEYESTINEEIEYARMMQGYCLYHMQDYCTARRIFSELCGKYSKSATLMSYIALTYYHEGMTEQAIEAFNKAIGIATEGTIEAMIARINKAILLDKCGMPERSEEAISMAIMMHPENMAQLILDHTHLYETRDKENLSFDDMNALEAKEWSTEEIFYKLGAHLAEHGHMAAAIRVLHYVRGFAKDTSDIDAYIAYALWKSGQGELMYTAIENALNGKSWILFKLFGVPYSSNISAEAFISMLQ